MAARFRAAAVIETLDRLACLHGLPVYLRCDNGPEFIAHTVKKWAKENDVEIAYTDPGKPWQNGSIESLNSRLRDECLDMEWFASREEARVIIECWRQEYNLRRPHSAISYKTPNEVRMAWQNQKHLAEEVAA